MKYRLVEYYTGKQIGGDYQSEKEALSGKQEYLSQCVKDKVVHNNLLIVEKINHEKR